MKNFDKYSTIAPDYHYRQIDKKAFRRYNASLDTRFQRLVKNVEKEAGDRTLKLLDVGCGDGVALYLISKRCPNIELHGVEPDNMALEMAKKHLPNAVLNNSNSNSLSFRDNFFDMVISSDVIEHVDDPDRMLSEIKRVSKENAIVIVGTPIRRTKHPIDPHHVQEFFTEDFMELMSKRFRDCKLHESHNLIPTILYNAPTKSFLNFKYLINLLSLLFGYSPFNSERKNLTQMFTYMYVICRK